ncbi:MAG: polyphenol oxidase family protein [Coriobacteriia bacterium]
MPPERSSMSFAIPTLQRIKGDGVIVHTDSQLRQRSGIVVAFSERVGGVSQPPYDSLNLAAHVADDPHDVDANRARLLAALDLGHLASALVSAEQTHGQHITRIGSVDAGRGAFASAGRHPLPATDALLTRERDIPLLLLYADCVPVILVAEGPDLAVAVVHAGWRGALASLPGKAVAALCAQVGCEPAGVYAYVGPHIGSCCYEVQRDLISQFTGEFGTIAAVGGHLDLGAVVLSSLMSAGVRPERVARVNECTMDHADRFFSYRASGATGRHGAVAVITRKSDR